MVFKPTCETSHHMTYPKVLVRSEQSIGRLGVVESVMPPGSAGPRLHPPTRVAVATPATARAPIVPRATLLPDSACRVSIQPRG